MEDEAEPVRALRINLRARQYEVLIAGTGREALALAVTRPPDAIILDLGLPDIDGTEVIVELRRWCHAPIIVLSGRTSPGDKIGALDAGADDYVTKPFAMAELLARLRAALRRDEGGAAAGSRPAPLPAARARHGLPLPAVGSTWRNERPGNSACLISPYRRLFLDAFFRRLLPGGRSTLEDLNASTFRSRLFMTIQPTSPPTETTAAATDPIVSIYPIALRVVPAIFARL